MLKQLVGEKIQYKLEYKDYGIGTIKDADDSSSTILVDFGFGETKSLIYPDVFLGGWATTKSEKINKCISPLDNKKWEAERQITKEQVRRDWEKTDKSRYWSYSNSYGNWSYDELYGYLEW